MTAQKEFTLTPRRRGFHLVTEEIRTTFPPLPPAGILHLFIKHTSAGLTINENEAPTTDRYGSHLQPPRKRTGTDYLNIHAKAMTICPPMPRNPQWNQPHHPHHQWASEHGYLARHLSLRVPQPGRRKKNCSNRHRIIPDHHAESHHHRCHFRHRTRSSQDTCTTRPAYRHCRQKERGIACPAQPPHPTG